MHAAMKFLQIWRGAPASPAAKSSNGRHNDYQKDIKTECQDIHFNTSRSHFDQSYHLEDQCKYWGAGEKNSYLDILSHATCQTLPSAHQQGNADGVIFTDLKKSYSTKSYRIPHPQLLKHFILLPPLFLLVLYSCQALSAHIGCSQSPHTRPSNPSQFCMDLLLQLLALASSALAAAIGPRTPASAGCTVAIPATCPADASPNIDPSFPGYAIELASVVEYATG